MQTVYFQDLGNCPYNLAWDYQTRLHRQLIDNKLAHKGEDREAYAQNHYLLFVEHPPVYTLGKSGSMDHLLLDENQLNENQIEFFPINRGGDITFHGPGQLVVYPILDLDRFFNDVHLYVRGLEEIVIRTLAEYGIEAYRIKEYTGVWLKNPPQRTIATEEAPFFNTQRKICAIGVHLSRWVSLHGLAFNLNTPLHYFNYIVPCGISDASKSVTSLEREIGHPVDPETVKHQLKRHFEAVFNCHLEHWPESIPSI